MIDFTCPACDYKRQIDDRFHRRKWRCPSCTAKIKHRGGTWFQIREEGHLPEEPVGTSGAADLPEVSLDAPADATTAEAPAMPAPDQLTGTALGHYRLRELIGSGADGHVYRAEHQTLQRPAAVKVLSPRLAPSPDHVLRLAREAVALAKVSHPNVVHVYDFGTENGTPYIVMQLVDGLSLSKTVKAAGPLSNERLLKLGRELLAGLDAIHQVNLLHRDIKPGNVLISKNGEALLADFGLAWEAPAGPPDPAGIFSGTIDYAAPELVRGKPPDVRTDLYALGSTLYFAVTGRPPYGAKVAADQLKRQLHEPLTPARAFNPQLPPDFDALLTKLLSKEREDRPSSARQAAQILNPAAPEPPPPVDAEARPAARVISVRSSSTPLGPVLLAAGVLLIALIAMLFVATRPKPETAPPPPPPPPSARPSLPVRPKPPDSQPRSDPFEKADLERLQRTIATEPPASALRACTDFIERYPNSVHVESVLVKKMELHQELERQSGKRPTPGATMWTFKLKSGGKIQAPSYEELPDSYVVNVAGTSIRLAKSEVDDLVKTDPQEK